MDAPEGLAKTATEFRAVVDEAPICLAYLDPQFRFVHVNQRMVRSCGRSAEELIGRGHFELFPHAENQALFEKVLATGEPVTFLEKPFNHPRRPGGEMTFWDWTLAPVRDAGGEIVGLVLASNEVTDRVRFQEALAKERDFISAILDVAGSLVVVLDTEGRILRFNRACQQVSGYTFEEVRGRRSYEFLLLPEEVDGVYAAIADLRAGHLPSRHENSWVAKDGSRRRIAWSSTVLVDAEGRIEYLIATGIEVTEQREAEARLAAGTAKLREQAAILDQAHVLVRDLDDRITSWTLGSERLYGFSREEAMGENSHDLLQTKFPAPHEEILANLRREGRWHGKLRHVRRDGTEVVVASHWVLHRDDRGEPVAILEVNNDISEIERLEVVLRASERELSLRNRISEVFLARADDQVFVDLLAVLVEATASRTGFLGYIDEDGSLVCPCFSAEEWERCQVQDKSIVVPRERWSGTWEQALLRDDPSS